MAPVDVPDFRCPEKFLLQSVELQSQPNPAVSAGLLRISRARLTRGSTRDELAFFQTDRKVITIQT